MLTLTPELSKLMLSKGFNWKVLPNEISYETAQKWLVDVHKLYLDVIHDRSNKNAVMWVYNLYDSNTGEEFNSLQSKEAFILKEQALERGLFVALHTIKSN